jgi:2'-5' RNA ligase
MASRKRRLGVALLLDPPVADQIEGLRRALGDPSVGRIPPHLTLVPPVNVRAADLPAALARLRAAAGGQPGGLPLTLGPVRSFLPANPVLYLDVGGELSRLRDLRDAVFAQPLERALSWPWVPHVTVADGIAEARVEAAVEVLDGYAVVAGIDRVVLLEEHAGRIWAPIADAGFGRPAVVGTGGLALEISGSRMIDPEASQMVEDAVGPADPEGRDGPPVGLRARCGADDVPPFHPIVVTGRRHGQLVGVAAARACPGEGHVGVVVSPEARLQGVGGHLLAHLEAAARRAGWPYQVLVADGPAGFYRARSDWSVAG